MQRRDALQPGTILVRTLVPAPLAPLRAFVAEAQTRPPLAPFPRLRLIAVDIDVAGDVVASLELGRSTEIRLAWRFEELRAATGVELEASIPRASLVVRALMRLGGAGLVERRLSKALAELAEVARLAAAAGSLSNAKGCEAGLRAAAVSAGSAGTQRTMSEGGIRTLEAPRDA
jgi:hypothetical protein